MSSQFTTSEYIETLESNGIAISMDRKGCWRDSVFIERPWRMIKYEEVYLCARDTVSEANVHLARYVGFYNGRRPHSSLDGRTLDHGYVIGRPLSAAT